MGNYHNKQIEVLNREKTTTDENYIKFKSSRFNKDGCLGVVANMIAHSWPLVEHNDTFLLLSYRGSVYDLSLWKKGCNFYKDCKIEAVKEHPQICNQCRYFSLRDFVYDSDTKKRLGSSYECLKTKELVSMYDSCSEYKRK